MPPSSSDQGRLVIISGPQAAGKTTIGHELATRLDRAVHIDGDLIQDLIVSGAVPMDLPPPPGALEQLHLRYLGALALANLYRDAGFDAIISDNLFEDGVDMILTAALKGDLSDNVHFVMLDPSIDSIWERYSARSGGGYTDSITPEGLKLAVSRTTRHGLWLDTTRQSVAETTDEIVHRLPEARVLASDLVTTLGC